MKRGLPERIDWAEVREDGLAWYWFVARFKPHWPQKWTSLDAMPAEAIEAWLLMDLSYEVTQIPPPPEKKERRRR